MATWDAVPDRPVPEPGWHHRRMPSTVTVIRDGGVRARGYRDGDAIVYDSGFTWQGTVTL